MQKAKPKAPEMSDLPPARLISFSRPFSYVGVDYFGPMIVTVGRERSDIWGVLITCLTIRAIHIELVLILNTDSCIMAIRNFISGANNELIREWQLVKTLELQEKFTSSATKWFLTL